MKVSVVELICMVSIINFTNLCHLTNKEIFRISRFNLYVCLFRIVLYGTKSSVLDYGCNI